LHQKRTSTPCWTRPGKEKALSEIVTAPVDVPQGVSEGDAKLLREAFNIKTGQDLGTTYFRAAQLLTQLAELGAK
jgi:hypothetical protein